jgi:hypothetical protein
LSSTSLELAVESEPPTSNIPNEEEIQPLEYPFDIEDNVFSDFENASNQPMQKKSTAQKAPNCHILDQLEEQYLKEKI